MTLINDAKIESTLYTWNEKSGNGDHMFRGELEWKVKPAQTYGSYAEFGFCVEYDSANGGWDCMSTRTNLKNLD